MYNKRRDLHAYFSIFSATKDHYTNLTIEILFLNRFENNWHNKDASLPIHKNVEPLEIFRETSLVHRGRHFPFIFQRFYIYILYLFHLLNPPLFLGRFPPVFSRNKSEKGTQWHNRVSSIVPAFCHNEREATSRLPSRDYPFFIAFLCIFPFDPT